MLMKYRIPTQTFLKWTAPQTKVFEMDAKKKEKVKEKEKEKEKGKEKKSVLLWDSPFKEVQV